MLLGSKEYILGILVIKILFFLRINVICPYLLQLTYRIFSNYQKSKTAKGVSVLYHITLFWKDNDHKKAWENWKISFFMNSRWIVF